MIGIGTYKLPRDDDEAIKLIRYAIDSGMTYIDGSRGYWDIELRIAKALKDGYREKILLSSKWSPWVMEMEECNEPTEYCIRKRIEESLKRLEVDYLDFYQLWYINTREHFKIATKKGGMVDGILKAIDEGLVKKIGYTTHNTPEGVIDNLTKFDWPSMVLVSYNLLNQRHEKSLEFAHKKGVTTAIMNPLGGGSFLRGNSFLQSLADVIEVKSIANLSTRFVLSNKNIDIILSGIANKSNVDDTLASIEEGPLNDNQIDYVKNFINHNKKMDGFCVSCNYCMPCPQRINIPSIMQCIFLDKGLGNMEEAKLNYSKMEEGIKAEACIACGQCEKKCPQKLNIIDGMKHAMENYR